MSKCRSCGEAAVIDLPRHNANFCTEHFVQLCRRQLSKAISDFGMFTGDDRILVAVSGGKDSLALWDMLIDAGFQADGLYIGLGIGDYSTESGAITRRFAQRRRLKLLEVDIRNEHGFDIPTAAGVTGRSPCSACGLSKRHIFDEVAQREGYDVLATGHNLDDEAAVLFGNTLRWDVEYLRRQGPVLHSGNGFGKKVKPLVRLTEREMAAWCVVRGIEYVVEECPMAVGNKHLAYKDALNTLDSTSPGTKASFYLGFLARMRPLIEHSASITAPGSCPRCGAPSGTSDEACAFCRLVGTTSGHEQIPVRMVLNKKARKLFDAQWGSQHGD